MRSSALTIILAGMLAFSLTDCSKKGQKGEPGKSDSTGAAAQRVDAGKVLAKVGGKTITGSDVAMQQDMLMQQLRGYTDSTQIAAMMPRIRKQAFDNAINRILLEGAVKKLDIKASKELVDQRIDVYRKNFVSDETFKADLAKRGVTQDQMRREIEVGLEAEELFNRRTAHIKPSSDQEIRSFYDNNGDRFQQPERVRASHILLTVNKDDSDATRTQKKQQAQRILGELKSGADFAEAARKYSGCPSKEQGGDLGYFERGRMVPEFEKVAFTLKTGQLSGVVETQFGYHIIKVTDHGKPSTVPLDEAKENIARYLTDQKKQQAIMTYFDSLRTVSKIQYFDSSLVR